MLRHLLAATVAVIGLTAPVSAQTFFLDNFNRTNSSTVGTPQVGGTYTETSTAPANAQILGNLLDITNGTGANSGNDYVSSTIGGSFTNLSALSVFSQWTFNMRYNRTTAPSGFGANAYGIATVLAATSTNFDTANGYAVVYGRAGTNVIELVRFSGGLDADGNLTAILSSGTNPLGTVNDFASFRVTFDNVADRWRLFIRDDGAAGFADPSSGVTTQVGAGVVDNTFIGSGNQLGFYWSHGGTDNQTAQFDNMTFAAVPEPTTWALIGLSAAGLIGGVYRCRRGATKTLNTEVDVEENEVA